MDVKSPTALEAHDRAVARDLQLLNLPPGNWPASVIAPDGRPALDVAIVGAGMLGIAAAAALIFKGVRNIVLFDRAEAGREGPWVTYARMETLRSPKHLTGPACGIPSLTFCAWYEARHGRDAWDALYKIPNATWMDYLGWLRGVLKLPVENGVEVTGFDFEAGLLRLSLRRPSGPATAWARRLVFATGRDGAGGLALPEFVARDLWPDLAAHTNESIDFARLEGKSVAILGAGASAWDNAAAALEAGATRVDMYARRKALPQINKSRGSAHSGYFLGWSALSDAERWALTVYMEDLDSPPPHESVHRVIRHPGFRLNLAAPIVSAAHDGARVAYRVDGEGAPRFADFLVVATGFRVDLAEQPEFAAVASSIATWGDRYAPAPELRRAELERYPYLGPGFELTEREPGTLPWLSRVHLFNYGAHLSHRALSGDVPGVDAGADRLAHALAASLFREDIADHWRRLEAFAEPELEGTPFFAPEAFG
jgi:cation diffusion facilitator CzcD-associated flavoprotein CzcO